MMSDPEVQRVERTYEAYATNSRVQRKWSSTNPGNLEILRERDEVIRRALAGRGMWPPVGARILDVGCGSGAMLQKLITWGSDPGLCVGVDLLRDRLSLAATHEMRPGLVRGDGRYLPFAENSFGFVLAFTLFSSILDHQMQSDVADEVTRVLVTGGSVLWYDFRVRSPWNPNTRGMRRSHIRELFPGYQYSLRSVTLVPQIARRLGAVTRLTYPLAAHVPVLRTHYAGLLTKP